MNLFTIHSISCFLLHVSTSSFDIDILYQIDKSSFSKSLKNTDFGLSLTQDSKPESGQSDKFIEKTDPRCHATSHFGTGLYVDLWVNNAGVMGKNCIRDGKFLN